MGFHVGSTNENGVLLIGYDSPTGKAPTMMLAGIGPWNENKAQNVDAVVWEAAANHAQIRIRNLITGQWVPKNPVRVSWVAVWQ
ncbi:hypothetical protein [Bifidobacterium samirii]|uniref:Uncharacterized protein n=1 Tax=Bifidobacterium samirii TaxID=2306974 RepID=A0A430FUE5_9BIFI|nr:hypothetical protein [Bifidobacterium samirii]RSX56781.1 hypothetical protein D2E24_1071 [Bifidobacterium samirii]